MFRNAFYASCFLYAMAASHVFADDTAATPSTVAASPSPAAPSQTATTGASQECKAALKEEKSVTKHTVNINGQVISYVATAGTQILKDDDGNTRAIMSYTAYTKDGEDPSKRPITFCFNGGPGSSSVWLHMGVFGPQRVALNDEGYALLPYHTVDNEYSILDVTDLVFIDPVSTGFSRTAPGVNAKEFHGVDEDIRAMANFIRLYTTRNSRWESPKFVAGESYGTTRAAGLIDYLHDQEFMYFNGVILVSSVLNFQAHDFNEGNDLPYVLYLPTYTASAWYHKRLPQEQQSKNLEQLLKEVRDFAWKDYTLALMKGDLMNQQEKEQMAQQLANYTGLSQSFYLESNLRVNIFRFCSELLRKQRRIVGRFDSRYQGINNDVTSCTMGFDPSLEAIAGVFTATLNQYMRNSLKFEMDPNYKILVSVSPWDWTFNKSVNQYLNVADSLRQTMTKNPALRVFVANGFYDLATPFAATEYTFQHLGLDPSLQSHVTMEYYDAGHMMYVYHPALVKMKEDLRKFINETLSIDVRRNENGTRTQTRGISASLD